MKYGREATPVRFQLSPRDDGMVQMSVADEGEGIPTEHIPRLTERFYRVDSGRSRAMGGTGLGLAIVKHIVERHRGKLDISSIVGEGTTVTVELPLAPPAVS
jgi:two-component system phosphate regulon sensor histidine kinase PhoR